MRLLGLDVGDVLIGVAVSDPSATIAQGLSSIKRVNIKKDIETIKALAEQYEIGRIVVGLPKMMNGEIGIQAQKVLDFVEKLRNMTTETPIVLWDERLTTVSANRALIEGNMRREKRKQVVDKVAATLILQGYLDSKKDYSESDDSA